MGIWLWTMLTSKHHKKWYTDCSFTWFWFSICLMLGLGTVLIGPKNRRVPESNGGQPCSTIFYCAATWQHECEFRGSCHRPATLLRRSLLVLGRSGSGKSTLLRALLKKLFPDYTGPLHFGSSEFYPEEINIPIFGSVERLDSPSNQQTEWQNWRVKAGNIQLLECFPHLPTMLNLLKGIHVESGQKAVHLSRTSTAQKKAGLSCSLKQNWETVMSHERLWIYCWFDSLSAWKLCKLLQLLIRC